MTTIANIAQRILDENGYTLTDFPNLTLTILEYKIDDSIDYVNSQTGLAIATLSGSAGSKSFVYTAPQNIPVKGLTNLMLKAYKEKGSTVGLGSMNVSYLEANPDFKLSMELMKDIINRLKEPPIYVSEDEVPTE